MYLFVMMGDLTYIAEQGGLFGLWVVHLCMDWLIYRTSCIEELMGWYVIQVEVSRTITS